MTEEEKKITKRLKDDIALVTFNDNLNYGIGNLYVNINDLKIILNLISKLQADIEKLDSENIRTRATLNEVTKDYIHKDKIKDIFRKAQDYDLSYKDTALFNLIMQEIEGQNKWYSLEDIENDTKNK